MDLFNSVTNILRKHILYPLPQINALCYFFRSFLLFYLTNKIKLFEVTNNSNSYSRVIFTNEKYLFKVNK